MRIESPTNPSKPLLSRRNFLKGVVGAMAVATIPGCRTESKSGMPTKSTIPIPETPPFTTEPLPPTTVEQKPTDVMEVYPDGSELLRNSGILYKGEKNKLPEWFGGIEIHIIDMDGNRTGFQEGAQNTVLDSILWAFGNQHPEFINPDGQVNIEAYKAYLEQNNWIDPQVFLPDNISTGPGGGYPPVAPSAPLQLDFKKPFVISNDDPSQIEGFTFENPNYFIVTGSYDVRTMIGINNGGQLFFGVHKLDSQLQITPVEVDISYAYIVTTELGSILTVTSRITYPEESPELQYKTPSNYYYDSALKIPTGKIPPYQVLDINEFITVDRPNDTVWERLFTPVITSAT